MSPDHKEYFTRSTNLLIILLILVFILYIFEFSRETNWENVQRVSYKDVLILGDSISIGYTPYVKNKLKMKADINRPLASELKYFPISHGVPLNCCGTSYSIENIDNWLADKKWDVIHFNWGLWDTVLIGPDKYKYNLGILIDKLKQHGEVLIMATTTPICTETTGGRGQISRANKIIQFNKILKQFSRGNGIEINDLYKRLVGRNKYYTSDGVHLTKEGYRFLSEEIVNAIENTL